MTTSTRRPIWFLTYPALPQGNGRKIALYANSRRHAGENIDELLKDRSAELSRPIQMADALAANWSGRETVAGVPLDNNLADEVSVK